MSTVKESIILFYKDGGSDKEYRVYLNDANGVYVVNFAFGKRGSATSVGTKTATPVDYITAKKIYDKLVQEKTAKGYKPDANAAVTTVVIPTDNTKVASGFAPQLLNPITEEEAQKYIKDPDWLEEEKHDGNRVGAKIDANGVVVCSNRKGIIITLIQEITDALSQFKECEVDGERVGDTFILFDALTINGKDITGKGCLDRYTELKTYIDAMNNSKHIVVTKLAQRGKKQEFFDEVKARKGEGVVFKHKDAPYVSGRPNSGGNQFKCKFWDSATCKVIRVNNSRSVALAMSDNKFIGNVTIPANYDIPVVGDFVEIKYLYAVACLYQPQYLGVRDDKTEADTPQSLKYKGTDSDDNS